VVEVSKVNLRAVTNISNINKCITDFFTSVQSDLKSCVFNFSSFTCFVQNDRLQKDIINMH
jgi:hypothetical protein